MSAAERFIEAFWRKVQIGAPEECWPWTGYTKPSGHGLTQHNGTPVHASRKAWILTNGNPGKLCVLHRCDNARCCNPAHMYLGTRADNMFDRFGNETERQHRGRPYLLTQEQLEELWKMRHEGVTLKECARKFNVHTATICRYVTSVRRAKLSKNRADALSRVAR